MRFFALLFILLSLTGPARADVVDDAFQTAFATFERIYPQLEGSTFGVDTGAYRDALSLQRFTSPFWGQPLRLDITRGSQQGPCDRFAAYVTLPPQDGAVAMVICPRFQESGTAALRVLTILHEMVHVVAGPSECRAMAFAAHVEQLATGAYTPVDRYWQANGCQGSEFRLP